MGLMEAVQPQHPVVLDLLERSECHRGCPVAVRAERLCRELRLWRYSSRLGLSSYESVAADRAANCIDFAVLICAALRASGPEPVYVLMGSQRGRFPAVVHAWVYFYDPGAEAWLLIDPVDRTPVAYQPTQLAEDLTVIAAWNDERLACSDGDRRALWDGASREDDSMEATEGMDMPGDRRAVRREPLVVEEQGEGFHAVLAGQVGAVLITNDVGRQVLELCDGTRSERDIVAQLQRDYPDADAASLVNDVETFLRTAEEKGTISWQPAGESP